MELQNILMQLQDSMVEEIRDAADRELWRRRQMDCERIKRETLEETPSAPAQTTSDRDKV